VSSPPFLDGYCSTVQGLLDWFEVDLGFTELLIIHWQIDLCVMCVFVIFWREELPRSVITSDRHTAHCSKMTIRFRILDFSKTG